MSQQPFDFGRVYSVTDAARTVYRSLNDAIDIVGILPAAGACGIDRGDLRRSLDRDGRRVAVEHAMAIAALCDYDARKRVGNAFLEPLGFRIADAGPPLSDKERADRYEVALRTLGPLGEQAMRNALGGKP